MKQVTRYESSDGKLFLTEAACREHEEVLDIVSYLESSHTDIDWDRTSAEEVVSVLLCKYIITPYDPLSDTATS